MLKVFTHHVKTSTVMEFVADAALCFLAIILAANQSLFGEELPFNGSQVTLLALQFACVMAMMYSFVGLYRRNALTIGLRARLGRALLAVVFGALIASVALNPNGQRGYFDLLEWAILYVTISAVAVRAVAYVAQKKSTYATRVLIIGTGTEAHAVARDLDAPGAMQAHVVGFYPTSDVPPSPGSRVLPRSKSVEDTVREHRVHHIVVAVKEQRGGGVPMDQLLACRIRGVRVMDLAGFYELAYGEVPTDSLKASYLVYGQGFVQSTMRRAVKRMFDIVCASGLLLLASPVMLCAAIAVSLESEGPIIYRQERVGKGGSRFMCLKFRSMRSDAEKDGVARWATKNDSRVTRVGAVMRKTRIDELPQLWSVLRGEMSMVGPRPERPGFVEALREQIPFYDIRHSVKPGVTGWAQVRYGYCATIDDSRRKHQFDLYYVKNNSLMLDLLVLLETVSVVVFREGSQ